MEATMLYTQEILVKLMDEGTEVWRPVTAYRSEDGRFQIAGTVPEDETWEFAPGTWVCCAEKVFPDGEVKMVVMARL